MTNLNGRLGRLEKQSQGRRDPGDILALRRVDYRAGLVPGVSAPADSLPVVFVDYTQAEADHEQP